MRGGPAKAAILASGLNWFNFWFICSKYCNYRNIHNTNNEKNWITTSQSWSSGSCCIRKWSNHATNYGSCSFCYGRAFRYIIFYCYYSCIFYQQSFHILHYFIFHILESVKLNIKGLPESEIPLGKTFFGGIHFLIPIFILIYLLLVERWTAASSVFYSILSLMVIIFVRELLDAKKMILTLINALKVGLNKVVGGLKKALLI